MKTTRETQRRWLLALGAITLAAAVSGCSALIAKSGVSSVGEIYKPETRAEVREAFGEPDETRTCPDGRTVERRAIRRQVEWVCKFEHGRYSHDGSFGAEAGCSALAGAYEGSLGLVDVFVIPLIVYRSEQAKLHYVFVYGADDRVLCRYKDTYVPSSRFGEAVRPLTDSLSLQLKEGGCPSWEACLSAFAAEVRQRAACVDYALTAEEEETLRLVHALAADVDAGGLTPGRDFGRTPVVPAQHPLVLPPALARPVRVDDGGRSLPGGVNRLRRTAGCQDVGTEEGIVRRRSGGCRSRLDTERRRANIMS